VHAPAILHPRRHPDRSGGELGAILGAAAMMVLLVVIIAAIVLVGGLFVARRMMS
jgi:hypothetical protein